MATGCGMIERTSCEPAKRCADGHALIKREKYLIFVDVVLAMHTMSATPPDTRGRREQIQSSGKNRKKVGRYTARTDGDCCRDPAANLHGTNADLYTPSADTSRTSFGPRPTPVRPAETSQRSYIDIFCCNRQENLNTLRAKPSHTPSPTKNNSYVVDAFRDLDVVAAHFALR